jgi:SAM-dependent methyltransferase
MGRDKTYARRFVVYDMNSINLSQPTAYCPLCGRSSKLATLIPAAPEFATRTTIPVIGTFAYYQCKCGLYYAAHYMTDEDTHEFYADGDYRLHSSGAAGISDDLLASEQRHADILTPEIYARVQSCMSILDIGCSSGVLLAELQSHYDCMVVGVEWSWRLRESCWTDHEILCFPDMNINGQFDLIILSHVLEHTLKPMELLREVYNLLSGRLFVQVPLMMPGIPHPLTFTESTAVWMVERAGYRVLSAHAVKTPHPSIDYFTIWAGKGGE